MHNRITTVLLAGLGLVAGGAYAQTAAPQSPAVDQRANVPVFRVTVVGRTTPAINYRPRSGSTTIDFAGTPLLPESRGHATVKGKDGAIEIDARFNKLKSAASFGPEYLTYVLWAVTPEGRATNLGELQVAGDDGDLKVTTHLQAFGLIVTAEPYFAVTRPSDVVVMENAVRPETVGDIEVIQAKYELLKRGSYLMNQDATRLKLKPIEPGVPLDLAQARNAVALARVAGADRYAADTFEKAAQMLSEAESARAGKLNANAVMMPARQAAQTAEDARLIALQRQEEEFAADERAAARQREMNALERAQSEQRRREQADNEKRAAEEARLAAERAKADAERQKADAERQKADLERQKADAERAKSEADRARTEADRARSEAEQNAARLAQERAAAEAARTAAEAQAQASAAQAQQNAEQAEREKAQLREQLREQLNVILETRETARGLIVNLSDVLFDTGSANLKPGAREKLAKIAGIVLAHPGLDLSVEGHTDSVGGDSYNLRLSERRAQSVHDYLIRQGIAPTAVATAGFGESRPVATNGTAAGRQRNRRVELVVSGEPIGRGR